MKLWVFHCLKNVSIMLKFDWKFHSGISRVDTRSNSQTGKAILIHKKGSKVVSLHCNPVQPDLLLSCGNDHFVRLLSPNYITWYFILLILSCCISLAFCIPSIHGDFMFLLLQSSITKILQIVCTHAQFPHVILHTTLLTIKHPYHLRLVYGICVD